MCILSVGLVVSAVAFSDKVNQDIAEVFKKIFFYAVIPLFGCVVVPLLYFMLRHFYENCIQHSDGIRTPKGMFSLAEEAAKWEKKNGKIPINVISNLDVEEAPIEIGAKTALLPTPPQNQNKKICGCIIL